ncbi:hypothetical protein WA171_000662 [Blastocystis sp. BT1]
MYPITKKVIDNALRHGIMFEFRLSASFRDRFNLKNLFIVANILTYYTRGRNIIFGWHVYAFRMTSSDPISPIELKAPYEYIAIARLLGLPMDKAYAVVTQNVIDAIAHGERRRYESSGVIL